MNQKSFCIKYLWEFSTREFLNIFSCCKITFTKNKNKNSGKLGFSLNKLFFEHLVLKKRNNGLFKYIT
jgi:hypothetical protein